MSRSYAESRVQDALKAADGNTAQAQRVILGWIEKDHSLLLGLVEPHLKGIIAHAMAHAQKRGDALQKLDLSSIEKGDLGAAVVGSLLGGGGAAAAEFGKTPRGNSPRPQQASDEHAAVLRRIARPIGGGAVGGTSAGDGAGGKGKKGKGKA